MKNNNQITAEQDVLLDQLATIFVDSIKAELEEKYGRGGYILSLNENEDER
jgi:hypothetical protein